MPLPGFTHAFKTALGLAETRAGGDTTIKTAIRATQANPARLVKALFITTFSLLTRIWCRDNVDREKRVVKMN
jgi:hypothetical protein